MRNCDELSTLFFWSSLSLHLQVFYRIFQDVLHTLQTVTYFWRSKLIFLSFWKYNLKLLNIHGTLGIIYFCLKILIIFCSFPLKITAWKVSIFEVILVRIFPHSVWMWENTDQKNSEYGHFSRSEYLDLKFFLHYQRNLLILSCVMFNYDQTLLKNFAVFTPQDFWRMFSHFSTLCIKGLTEQN